MQAVKECQPQLYELKCSAFLTRRLCVTKEGHVSMDSGNCDCLYQKWKQEGKDTSFALKNEATGKYLSYKNKKVTVECSPFKWSLDKDLSQIYPEDESDKALAVPLDNPHHVIVDDYKPDEETQMWESIVVPGPKA